ncbi:MAG: patatin-like phospholipase family protein [Sphingobacteriia bacterium]|nr:patatin-like phospholipase family protein [Sphingobacteriia bacterium]
MFSHLKHITLYLLIVLLNPIILLKNVKADNFSTVTRQGSIPNKRIKILSIDGGGIRGLIPAMVLKDLEGRLKSNKKLVDCFDIMAGASTGGLIILLLNTPDSNGKPKYNIDDVLSLYKNLGQDVFEKSLWQNAKSFFGWVDAKYSEKSFESLLEKYFADTELKNTITNVILPAYEIEKDMTFFFKTSRAKNDPERNYKLKDLARAITAAPTYFRPAVVQEMTGKNTYTFIDGGVAVNNPTLSATVHAVELHGYDNDFLIISLGTGTNIGSSSKKIERRDVENAGLLGWAKKIIPLMMYSENEVTDYQMRYVFDNHHPHNDYFRMQIILDPKNSEMDDTSPDNIAVLEQKAKELIKKNDENLNLIAEALCE